MASRDGERCPRCDSPKPHLHPAVQFECEVHVCPHEFHSRVTPENTPGRIAAVRAGTWDGTPKSEAPDVR